MVYIRSCIGDYYANLNVKVNACGAPIKGVHKGVCTSLRRLNIDDIRFCASGREPGASPAVGSSRWTGISAEHNFGPFTYFNAVANGPGTMIDVPACL